MSVSLQATGSGIKTDLLFTFHRDLPIRQPIESFYSANDFIFQNLIIAIKKVGI
jgi:hypothetical protein